MSDQPTPLDCTCSARFGTLRDQQDVPSAALALDGPQQRPPFVRLEGLGPGAAVLAPGPGRIEIRR